MSVKSIVVKLVAGCVLVALLVSAIYLLSKPEEAENTVLTVYSSDGNDVRQVEIKGEESFVISKDNGVWTMEGMEGIGVNNTYADTLVKSLTNITSTLLVEADAENLDPYGLSEPRAEITLRYEDTDETVLVGNQSGEYYYLTIKSRGDVYIVSTSDLYMVFLEKMKYLDDTALLVDVNRISKISLGDILLEKDGDDWTEKTPYNRTADANAVNTKVLAHLSEITALDIVTKDEAVLKEKTPVKLTMDDGDNVGFDIYSNGYLVHTSSDYAYKIGEETTAITSLTGFELINKYVAPISITEVVEIELISPKGKTLLTIDAPSTQAPIFYKNGEEATEESFRSFYQILMGLTFNGEGEASGAAEYAVIFTKEDGNKHDVRFISATESDFAVSINGKTQFTIAKKAVTDVFGYLKNIETI